MKLHPSIIVAIAVPLFCLGDYPNSTSNMSNTAISNEYAKLSRYWVSKMADLLSQPPVAAMESIKTVTCLRVKATSRTMLDYLNYPIGALPQHLTNSWCRSNEKKLFVPGLAPIRGDYRLIGTMFPMHAFLCSLGLKFDDLKSILNKYEQDHFSTYNTIIYTLGVNCAGRYFACYCSANAISTDPFPAVDLLPKKKDRVAGPADDRVGMFNESRELLFWHGADAATYSAYSNMEVTLLSRFATEFTSSSTNLPDTIATIGFIRSLDAIPVLADNLTICPQTSTNAPGGFVFPAAEAMISIGPAIGDCFDRLKATKPLSVEESLWLRISHELYPEGLEYELFCAAATNDTRAARLLQSLPWRRLADDDIRPLPR